MDGFPYRIWCKSPFLSDFFLKSEPYVHRPARKGGRQKKRTNKKETTKIWPISSSAGTMFWTTKCQIPVAKPLKSGSRNERRISLKRSTKEHLRLLLGRWHSPQVAPAAQKWSHNFLRPKLTLKISKYVRSQRRSSSRCSPETNTWI